MQYIENSEKSQRTDFFFFGSLLNIALVFLACVMNNFFGEFSLFHHIFVQTFRIPHFHPFAAVYSHFKHLSMKYKTIKDGCVLIYAIFIRIKYTQNRNQATEMSYWSAFSLKILWSCQFFVLNNEKKVEQQRNALFSSRVWCKW